jgi:2-polyprenyl-3-methyl-5-hydroxy-6-metoxy-1,4-benzoquinol methylase
MSEKQSYDEYFEAVFRHSNKFTEKEYIDQSRNLDLIYKDYLPEDKEAKIVDIGCGGGHFIYFLKNKGYTNFMGVDISQQQVEFVKKQFDVDVAHEDAFDFLSQNKDEFDLIVAHDILEHIQKDRAIEFLKLIKFALKPGGQVFIRTVNCGNPMAIRLRYADFTHEFCVTEKSFYQILYLAGFRNIKLLPSIDKGFFNKITAKFISFLIAKMMWYQGYVAPKIMTPLIFAIAKKDIK